MTVIAAAALAGCARPPEPAGPSTEPAKSVAPSTDPVAAEPAETEPAEPAVAAVAAVAAVLDDFHAAASAADEERYLGHMAADGVFLGTDGGERWDKDDFRAFVHPYFSQGRGWTYRPRDRHITIASGGGLAWFDELLDHDRYGELRGTGVLRAEAEGWKIVQYNLTFTIPNQVAGEVVERVRAHADRAGAEPEPTPEPGAE
ncbi:nuclear transport factor 2 family protein [Haliangium sp.]|uniref:nuclear transport factor 2 family protein n=1 Tax=Haliangium sp. TaxID=2663208 RepID=UPI003D11FEC4